MRQVDLKRTALLLVDLQNEEGTSDIVGMDTILQRTKALIHTCRTLDIPIIYTRHINRGDGIALANKEPVDENGSPIYYHSDSGSIAIPEMIKPEEQDIIIDKYRYSGFFESNLDMMLKGLGVKHLILGGVLTDVCVMATAMDAYYRDYQVNLVEDICGTTTAGAHMASVLMLANWVYDIHIFQSEQLQKKLRGENYHSWKSDKPDSLQFSPDNIREVFSKLK